MPVKLGHGRGPFDPYAFFLPAVLAAGFAAEIPGSESSAPNYQVAPAQTSVVYIFGGDDFAPQQAPSFVSDEAESEYRFVLPAPRQQQQQPSFQEDELPSQVAPSFISQEEHYAPPVPALSKSVAPFTADDDYIVPTGEEDAYLPVVLSTVSRAQLFTLDDELVQQPTGPAPPDEEYRYVGGQTAQAIFPRLFAIDDEIVPQGAPPPLVFEDDSWSVRLPARAPATIRVSAADDEIAPQGAAPSVFEEDRWPIALVQQVARIVRPFSADEDFAQAAAPRAFDDDYWPISVSRSTAAVRAVSGADEEFPTLAATPLTRAIGLSTGTVSLSPGASSSDSIGGGQNVGTVSIPSDSDSIPLAPSQSASVPINSAG